MTSEKLPPHDTSAEEAVNGSLLIDSASIYKIAGSLKPADFYHEPNRLIYEACLSLYQRNEAINQITIAQELDRQHKLEECGGAAYLSHLIANCPTSLDIETYAQIVYRLGIMRHLIAAAGQIAAIGYEAGTDVDASMDRAEEVLFRLRHGQSQRDLIHIRHVLDKYFEATTPAGVEVPTEPIPAIRSGFNKLDEFLGGFQRSDMIIVAGRPSMGKTSLALSIARNAAVTLGACVALFSMEMARDPLVLRLLSSEADVDSRRVRFGLHTEAEEKRIMEATGRLSEAQIYIDDSPLLRMVEVRSKARRLHFERGIDLIIVDYLQLLQGDVRSENRVQEISFISRSLKTLARELNVPVLAVSQLSRAVEWRASHRPQLSDLRESGSIEQDADLVVFIYRDDYYFPSREAWEKEHPGEEYPQGIANIIIAKHRNGPIGEIDLHFSPKTAKFEDITTSQEPSLL
ncbi:MAG: replicative DNA helicase [Desulfobacteraceae bacterium]